MDILQRLDKLSKSICRLGRLIVKTEVGNYTLILSDNGKLISMDSVIDVNLTIPPSSSIPFGAEKTSIMVLQMGLGQVNFVAGVGVTILTEGAKLKTAGQYATATLIEIETDTWLLVGNLTV